VPDHPPADASDVGRAAFDRVPPDMPPLSQLGSQRGLVEVAGGFGMPVRLGD
jgi:hypothetical protein